eukprot:515790_1
MSCFVNATLSLGIFLFHLFIRLIILFRSYYYSLGLISNQNCIIHSWYHSLLLLQRIIHILNQCTDIATVIYLFQITVSVNSDCYHNDIYYLLSWLICSILSYRVLCSSIHFGNCSRIMSQIFDFEIYYTLYIEFLFNKKTPCFCQQFIISFQAIFEAQLSIIVHIIFLYKFGDNNFNLITFSLICSFCILITTIIHFVYTDH